MTTSTRTANAKPAPAPQQAIPWWVDVLITLFIAGITLLALQLNGTILFETGRLLDDPKLSWHLVRSMGITAYALMEGSTLWGIFLSTRLIKDWSPGPTSLLLHAACSWLAVGFSIVHVVLLMADKYFAYQLPDLLIPFIGPYRPFAVGLGVIAFWLTLFITISFSLRKRIGQKTWRALHYLSYAAFGLITVHTVLAGTDSSKPGMQTLIVIFCVATALLLGWRLKQTRSA